MADFAGFAMAVARTEGQSERATRILAQMEEGRAKMLGESEPIWLALGKWLEIPANIGRQVTSAQLQAELSSVASAIQVSWPYKSG